MLEEMFPYVARIRTAPVCNAVTAPRPLTLATVVSDEDHCTSTFRT